MLPSLPLALLLVCGISGQTQAAVPTWPSPIYDELESLMMQFTGYRRRSFNAEVVSCGFSATNDKGRRESAEWVRTAYHDMATADVVAGTGGIDASIAFETDRAQNVGDGIPHSIGSFSLFYSSRASMSDLIALGVQTAVRACGGPFIPFRAGRIDAVAAGPIGVPEPQENITTLTSHFQRGGFNATDMIGLVACGHTLGGVHSQDFPEIVPNGTRPSNTGDFDSTASTKFDNMVVVEYLKGNSSDPLIHGPAETNSDAVVFGSDGNATMEAMRDPAVFADRCKVLLERMINTVPKEVTLSDIIIPYEVKPAGVRLAIASNTTLNFAGDIRVRTTVRRDISKVQLLFVDRDGGNSNCGNTNCTIDVPQNGFQFGLGGSFDERFTWYSFNTTVPSSSAASSFKVAITFTNGTVEIHDNNGHGFPVQNQVFFQPTASCSTLFTGGSSPVNSTIVAAVHFSRLSLPDPIIRVTWQRDRNVRFFPELVTFDVPMERLTVGAPVEMPKEYVYFTGTYSLPANATPKFDVRSGSGEQEEVDDFLNPISLIKNTCK